MGIADHAPSMPGSTHIFHFQNMRVIPREINGVKLLFGVEVNILDYNGTIDMDEDTLRMLDFSIASLHPPCIRWGTVQENTSAMIKTMKNPYINVIGHPDDGRYELDYEEFVKAAIDYNVLIELNNSSLDPTGFRQDSKKNAIKILELCEKHNAKVIMGSDAHISYSVGNFNYCLETIKEIGFNKDLIVNNKIEKLKPYLREGKFI